MEKRYLYLGVDTDEVDESVTVCKLPAALSGNAPIKFQPHDFTYTVKQTDIFLAPNQPVMLPEQSTKFTKRTTGQSNSPTQLTDHGQGTNLKMMKTMKTMLTVNIKKMR